MGIDPVGVDENNVHSHNRYAYANNNPYKFVDPDGRESVAVEEDDDIEAQYRRDFKIDATANAAKNVSEGMSTTGDVAVEGYKWWAGGKLLGVIGSALNKSAHLSIGAELTKVERSTMNGIFKGDKKLSDLSRSAREKAAKVYDQTAAKKGQTEVGIEYNKARAAHLREQGSNPGADARAFAEKHGLKMRKSEM